MAKSPHPLASARTHYNSLKQFFTEVSMARIHAEHIRHGGPTSFGLDIVPAATDFDLSLDEPDPNSLD